MGTEMHPIVISIAGLLIGTVTAEPMPSDERGEEIAQKAVSTDMIEGEKRLPQAITPGELSTAARILRAAEQYLGEPYVFGGRMGRSGCRSDGRRVACAQGIDCLSLIFFSFEDVLDRPWWRYSVVPTVSVERGELGQAVPGMAGILRDEFDATGLIAGDVLFFLLEDYNLDADEPLLELAGKRYGTWHTGLFHSHGGDQHKVLHAAPGDQVRIDNLQDISFDAIYVLRVP